ncbi:AEC family transporter [Fusobacterium sp.]|uniref:AEC family transporter n=1 Tax=Fusobacterium sp. TaxID=68766 RepID=UPI002635E860|nr:AEC family transporter [Fusobacterium sp.]
MLENLLVSLNVVFPIFVMLTIGVYVRRKNLVTDQSLSVMNKLVFRIFMSSLLFINISNMDIKSVLDIKNLKLMGVIWGCLFIITILSYFLFEKTMQDRNKIPVMIQGAYRANLALFGIPMAMSLYGDKGLGVMSLVSAGAIPLTNMMAVSLLEGYATKTVNFKKVFISILKNPLIICSTLALVVVFLDIRIPKLIKNPIVSLGQVATPLSFVVLGATLKFDSLVKNLKLSMVANVIKLVILPMIAITIGIKLGFKNEYLLGILGATGAPGAVSSFIMVKEIGGDENLAAELVVSSTLLSILTLFVWIFMLKTFGYL